MQSLNIIAYTIRVVCTIGCTCIVLDSKLDLKHFKLKYNKSIIAKYVTETYAGLF